MLARCNVEFLMNKLSYVSWINILSVGKENNVHGLERSRVKIVNSFSWLLLLVCTTYTVILAFAGVENKLHPIYSVPLYLLVLLLNARKQYKPAHFLSLYGTFLFITFLAFQNKRVGAEYCLVALMIYAALIEPNSFRVYIFSSLCALDFAGYKLYDLHTQFIPDPAINYDILENSLIITSGGIVLIQIMALRNLTEHYADEASNKYEQMQRALEIKKQTEEKLKSSNKELEQLRDQLEWIVKQKTNELQTYLDAINVNIYSSINDINGNFVRVNEPFTKQSGYTSNELVGRNMSMLNPGDYTSEFFLEIKNTVSNGMVWRGEIKQMSKTGNIYWTDQVIIPIKGKSDKINYLLTLALPITERKEQEESREKTLRLLESIAFKTSHKVRGPIARIQGLAGLVQNDLIDLHELKFVTKSMEESCKELNNATSELVKFINDHHETIEHNLKII